VVITFKETPLGPYRGQARARSAVTCMGPMESREPDDVDHLEQRQNSFRTMADISHTWEGLLVLCTLGDARPGALRRYVHDASRSVGADRNHSKITESYYRPPVSSVFPVISLCSFLHMRSSQKS
jgi:hypothetical protein